MSRSYFVVDAFTNERYAGNPAAVVLDAEGLNDAQMQAIAAEFNLSETTFVLSPERTEDQSTRHQSVAGAGGIAQAEACGSAFVRFRWFTPSCEVAMCGHATIAGLKALVESGRIVHCDPSSSTKIGIETRSGLLTGFIESIPGSDTGLMIWLQLVKPRLTEHAMPGSELAEVLGLEVDVFDDALPPSRTQDEDLIVFVQNFKILNDARPDFRRLTQWLDRERLRGMSLATVHTLSPSIHVQSRFFAPNVGVDEDAVTGSVHGPLASYLVAHELAPMHEGVAGLSCVQGKAGGRAGLVHALVRSETDGTHNVRIGGQAVITMRGTLL